jgi:hypothetical protein
MAEAIYTLSALALNPPTEDRYPLAARAVVYDADCAPGKPAMRGNGRPIPAALSVALGATAGRAIPSDTTVGPVDGIGVIANDLVVLAADGAFGVPTDPDMEEMTMGRASADEPARRRA